MFTQKLNYALQWQKLVGMWSENWGKAKTSFCWKCPENTHFSSDCTLLQLLFSASVGNSFGFSSGLFKAPLPVKPWLLWLAHYVVIGQQNPACIEYVSLSSALPGFVRGRVRLAATYEYIKCIHHPAPSRSVLVWQENTSGESYCLFQPHKQYREKKWGVETGLVEFSLLSMPCLSAASSERAPFPRPTHNRRRCWEGHGIRALM